MRLSALSLVASLSVLVHAHSADLYFPSIPEDPYAFPKYRVSFLNGFTLANTTAQRWLAQGLQGGEAEFLGKDAAADRGGAPSPPSPQSIEPGQVVVAQQQEHISHGADVGLPAAPQAPAPTLQLMHIGPKSSYLCLIPPPPPPPSFTSNEDRAAASAARSPATSWELLQPMSQGCLYYTLGWFTYAYCHNKYVKQFREAPHAHPHPPGGRIPQEDPEWESYYLGVAPSPETSGSDIASSEQIATANKLELARGAGQRYLIQRWDDGTLCDKTNQPRKIEVQFHCSMTTPDKIILIKEASVCSYVLVIHTPRLCGEPGFKSERASQEESVLRCREVVSDSIYAAEQSAIAAAAASSSAAAAPTSSLLLAKKTKKNSNVQQQQPESKPIKYIEAMHPFRFAPGQRPRAVLTPSVPAAAAGGTKGRQQQPKAAAGSAAGGGGKAAASGKKRDSADIIRDAIKALLSGGESAEDSVEVVVDSVNDDDDNGEAIETAAHSDDNHGQKQTRQPAAKQVAELFGREADDIVAVQGEDGTTSYFIVDNMEEVDDLDHFASLLDNAAEGGGKRLDAIRKRLLNSLTKSDGDESDSDSHHGDTASSSGDDNLPETHDEL